MIDLSSSWKALIAPTILIILAACQVPTPPVTPPPPPILTPTPTGPPTSTPVGRLEFETILKEIAGYDIDVVQFAPGQEFVFFVANSPEEVLQLNLMFRDYHRIEMSDKLQDIDLTDYFVLAVFKHSSGDICNEFSIKYVTQQNSILIYLDVVEYQLGTTCGEMVSEPYHIVKVKRNPPELTPNKDDIILKPVQVMATPRPTRPVKIFGPTLPRPTPRK